MGGSWRRRLSAVSTFAELSAELKVLQSAVRVPPQRLMLEQLLGEIRPQSAARCRGLPRPLAALVVSYVVQEVKPKLGLGDEVVPAEWWTVPGQFDLIRISQAARARADTAVTEMARPRAAAGSFA